LSTISVATSAPAFVRHIIATTPKSGKILRAIVFVALALAVGTSTSSACSCIPLGVKEDMANSRVVFRGRVKEIKRFPLRPESSRTRYAATFAASDFWKGNPVKEIVLHEFDPSTDCIGARFEVGKEYVVFAVSQEADDHKLGESYWYGWLDVLPKGTHILTVNNYCDSTSEVTKAGEILNALGRGKKP
jgi:hypothetical protein